MNDWNQILLEIMESGHVRLDKPFNIILKNGDGDEIELEVTISERK